MVIKQSSAGFISLEFLITGSIVIVAFFALIKNVAMALTTHRLQQDAYDLIHHIGSSPSPSMVKRHICNHFKSRHINYVVYKGSRIEIKHLISAARPTKKNHLAPSQRAIYIKHPSVAKTWIWAIGPKKQPLP